MTYIYLDDNFADHPKIVPLSNSAFRLHVSGILYANRHRTDGIIPMDAAAVMVGRPTRPLRELSERSLWLPLDDGRYYEIHDFLQWNKSRAEIEKLAATRADAARKRWRR